MNMSMNVDRFIPALKVEKKEKGSKLSFKKIKELQDSCFQN